MKRLFIGICIAFVVTITTAHAQSSNEITLTTIPLDPQPLQSVTITAESYGADLNQTSITWRYNEKVIDAGVGRTSITLTAPSSGSVGTVTMSAAINGEAITSTILLRPASMDLLWESTDSYTPPFYKGKALAAVNSTIKVSAIPSSSAPKQLVYNWSRNNTVLGSLSGFGKSSLVFKNSELQPSEQVRVEAMTGAFNGSSNLTITPSNPSVIAYQKSEGFIDYTHGSSSEITTNQPGLIVRLEPYFFSVPASIAQNLLFSITENGSEISSDTIPNELYLSAPETKGRSLFMIAINTVAYTLQNLTRNFSITFN